MSTTRRGFLGALFAVPALAHLLPFAAPTPAGLSARFIKHYSAITDGWSSGASSLKKGDIFTIASVFTVNPLR